MEVKKARLRFALLGVALLLMSVSSLVAGTYRVEPGGSIQAGFESLSPGDTLLISPGTYSEALRSVRNGSEERPIVVKKAPGGDVTISTAEQVLVVRHDYWVFDGFILDHEDAARDFIKISGNYSVIKNCEIRNGKRDGIEIGGGKGTRIESCIIHDFVWSRGNDAHGIVTDPGVEGLQVVNSTIYNCGGDGIQLYASSSTPVDEYSRDIEISGNVFYTELGPDSENALDFKGGDGVVVTNNEMYGFDNKAVVVQKGCRNLVFDRNIVHDSQRGMEFRGEGGKFIENLTVTRNVVYNIQRYYALKFDYVFNADVFNNTIANINGDSFRLEGDGVSGGAFHNNLVFNADAPKVEGGKNYGLGHNGWFDASDGELQGANDVSGDDPGLWNPGEGDFSLRSDSPALDVGKDVGLPFSGTAPDLGAVEFGLALGVRLNAFHARSITGGVVLAWETAGEDSAASYRIDRKTQGEANYSTITKVPALNAEVSTYEFVDRDLPPGDYRYRLSEIDAGGVVSQLGELDVSYGMPAQYSLGPNYPNPAHLHGSGGVVTNIPISLNVPGSVRLTIMNLLGQEVRELFHSPSAVGSHVISWDGRDHTGRLVGPGVYFYRLEYGGSTEYRAFALLR